MTADVFSQKGSAATADNRDERAQRAVKVFRALRPGLTGFARAYTGRQDVEVVLDDGIPRTDGKKIFYKPPIALGDLTPHQRRLCDKRDPTTKLQLCPACKVREEVIISIIHEISHITFKTFQQTSVRAQNEAIERTINELGSKWAETVRTNWSRVPDFKKNDYLNLSGLISPYLPLIVNGLEDARVDEAMFTARKGTRIMFDAYVQSIFANGIEADDGTMIEWRDKPLNSQAIIGTFILAAGYRYEGWFSPEVEAALNDKPLTDLCKRVGTLRSAAGTYELSFPILARLRELGFCRLPDDPDDEPVQEPEQEEQEEAQEDAQEDEKSDDSTGNKENEDAQEGEGFGTPDDSGTSDEGDSADADAPSSSNSEPGDGQGSSGTSSERSDDLQEPPEEADDGESDDSDPGDVDSDADSGNGGNDPGSEDDDERGSDSDGGEANGADSGDSEPSGADSSDSSDGPDEERDDSEHEVDSDGSEADSGPDGGTDDAESEAESDGEREGDSEGRDSGEATDSDANAGGLGGSGTDLKEGDLGGEEGTPKYGEGSSDEPTEDGKSEPGERDGDAGIPGQDGPADRLDEEAEGSEGGEEGSTEETSAGPAVSESPDSPEPADPASPTEGLTDLPDDDSDEAVDTGADEGKGGTKSDDANYGSVDEVINDIQVFGQHDIVIVVMTEPEEVKADEEAIDLAIIQGQYFEKPSAHIAGVREHFYGKETLDRDGKNTTDAWDMGYSERIKKKAGVDADLVVDEEILGPVLVQMRKTFAENKRANYQRHLKSGRINGRVLGKRAWSGDERLFQKKRIPGKRSYAVLIGIDISGSTLGKNLALAKRAAMAQAEECYRTGVDFAIYAHTANGDYRYDSSIHEYVYNDLTLDMYEIKAFDQGWDEQAKEALGAISSNAENLDGHGIEYYRKKIEKHTATDKIILYYTDGKMPAANYDEELEILVREINYCKAHKITLLGVGIRTDSPRRHGLDTVEVHEDSDLVKVVRHLETALLHNR